ncbi:MAG: hypothetical protein ACYDHY_17480 [Acidiferrobacterales bacterium]
MPVTAAWTAPTALDLADGDALIQTTWEELLGDLLYLYDVLTAAVALAVHLTSTLTVDGALALASEPTVGGHPLRRTTYGHTTESSPSIAAGGGSLNVSVSLADSVTPLAVEVTLDTGGYGVRLVAYPYSYSAGTVWVNVINWGAATVTSAFTVYVRGVY